MCNTNDFKCRQWLHIQCLVFVVEEAGQYRLRRLCFSDLSLKDEQCLSIRVVYEGSSVFM